MGNMFEKPKTINLAEKDKQANADKVKALETKLKIAETPSAMPDTGDQAVKRAKLRAVADEVQTSGSDSTSLTGSRLGDASPSVARRGRIKSSVMSGGASAA